MYSNDRALAKTITCTTQVNELLQQMSESVAIATKLQVGLH